MPWQFPGCIRTHCRFRGKLVLSLRGAGPKPIGLHSKWKLMVLHEWRQKWTALFSWSRAQILPPEPCVDCVGHRGIWGGTEWNDTWATWKWGRKALFFSKGQAQALLIISRCRRWGPVRSWRWGRKSSPERAPNSAWEHLLAQSGQMRMGCPGKDASGWG